MGLRYGTTRVTHVLTDAAAGFVDDSMVALVATVSPAGRPFVTPLWFVVDGGVLYMTTGHETRAARNVAQNPNVTLLFGGEAVRPGALQLRGTASRHRGLPPWRVLARIALKYYLAPGALLVELRNSGKWGLRARYYAQVPGGAGHLRVVPSAVEMLTRP